MLTHAPLPLVHALILVSLVPQEVSIQDAQGRCAITWSFRDGAVRHRANCSLPPSGQTPLIAKLLRGLPPFQTLDWGRLYPDGSRDATLAVRLALAALRSPDWDTRRGRPRRGDINAWVRKTANDAMIYSELHAALRDAGLDIRLSTVEKVLVLPARELPFFDKLRDAGAQDRHRLPFDCQAWFSVSPARRTVP